MNDGILEVVDAALRWCNDRRAEQGKPALKDLPQGKKTDPLSCPCGAATGLWVGKRSYHTKSRSESVDQSDFLPLTDGVVKFISAFDLGLIPRYDIDFDKERK